MSLKRFLVRHAHTHDSIAQIMMDEKLLEPEAEILDLTTLTLRGLKNGGVYTLEPLDDPRVMVLRRLRQAYLGLTEKPFSHFSTCMGRVDTLIDICGLLFSEVEFIKVENKDDLDRIINPPKDPDFEHKIVKVTTLGELLKDIIAEGATIDENADESDYVNELKAEVEEQTEPTEQP